MIRAFIGLPVPQPVVHSLAVSQIGLDVGYPVPPENFHVTLAFLGEHHEPVIEEVAQGLSLIVAEDFDIKISGLGTFGSAPRLMFAEVEQSPALSALRKCVRRTAVDAGIELPHERFHPHITLARFGRGLIGEDADRLRNHISRRLRQVQGQFSATEFTLYESQLGKSGPAYTALATFPLMGIGAAGATISS